MPALYVLKTKIRYNRKDGWNRTKGKFLKYVVNSHKNLIFAGLRTTKYYARLQILPILALAEDIEHILWECPSFNLR